MFDTSRQTGQLDAFQKRELFAAKYSVAPRGLQGRIYQPPPIKLFLCAARCAGFRAFATIMETINQSNH